MMNNYHDLAYFTHKRKTLDRISAIYSRRMLDRVARFYAAHASELFRSLEEGKEPEIKESKLDKDLEEVAISHAKKTISVGVSDGIQEVSDKKLHAWRDHPIDYPVELTISLDEQDKRDKISKEQEKEVIPKKKTIASIFKATKEAQIKILRNTYRSIASNWIKGEGTIKDVKQELTKSLQKSKSSIDRVFRTETTKYFNESRANYFQKYSSATYMQIRTIADGRRSGICESRAGWVFPIEEAKNKKNMPPFHPNCRTTQVPLNPKVKRERDIIDRGIKIDERRFKPLPKGWAN